MGNWKDTLEMSPEDAKVSKLTVEITVGAKRHLEQHTNEVEDWFRSMYGDDYCVTDIEFDETDDGATVAIVFKKK